MPTFWEPWPGKTSATVRPSRALISGPLGLRLAEQPLLLAVELGDLVVNFAVELRRRELHGAADGVLDGPGVGPPVADETAAVDPQEGRGPEFPVVGTLAEAVEGGFGEHVPRLGAGAALDLFAEHAEDHLGQSLGAFEDHVAHEAVADDHVGVAVEHVPPLDVAEEVQAGRLQDLEDLAGDVVPLPLLLADRHQADARRR